MTERDYAIRSFKEITLNAARHTEERMDLYYEEIKALMNNYQDLILENQMVLDELEQECQEKINENMAYALQYMDAYDYRMNLGKLKKEVNNIILIYGLCDMVNRAIKDMVKTISARKVKNRYIKKIKIRIAMKSILVFSFVML